MNSVLTLEQLAKLDVLLRQKGMTSERFESIWNSGFFFDLFDGRADYGDRRAFRRALSLSVLPNKTGEHVVDYSMSLEQMIDASGCVDDCQHPSWELSKLFTIAGTGKVEFEDAIFEFDRRMFTREVGQLIRASDPENPWEPASLENLLAYGTKNPEEQKNHGIMAFGSPAKSGDWNFISHLDFSMRKRILTFDRSATGAGWSESCRYLGVRRKKK